jgi:hypothetical protein
MRYGELRPGPRGRRVFLLNRVASFSRFGRDPRERDERRFPVNRL